MRPVRALLLSLLLLCTCAKSLLPAEAPSPYRPIRVAAFAYAKQCVLRAGGRVNNVKFSSIHWVIVPGDSLGVETQDSTEMGGVIIAEYYQTSNTVVITSAYASAFWVNAHELLHALGYREHTPFPFRTCKLMADQQSNE